MIFFTKSWEDDISEIQLAGIIFCYVTLFIYPAPQIFSLTTPVEVLLFASVSGVIFLLLSLAGIHFLNPGKELQKIIGAAVPDAKNIRHILFMLPAVLLAVGAITWHWKYTLKKLDIPFEDTQKLLEYADFSHPETFLLLVIMAVLVVPIAEELLFRRVIFALISKFAGFNAAGFISAGIFSIAHNFTAGIPGLFLMGIIFQWLYSKSRNLSCSILLHALCNAVSIMFAVLAKQYQC